MMCTAFYLILLTGFVASKNTTQSIGKLTSVWQSYKKCKDISVCQWERLHKCTTSSKPYVNCGTEVWREQFQGCQTCSSGSWYRISPLSTCNGTGCSDTVQEEVYGCEDTINQPNCRKTCTRFCDPKQVCNGQWSAWSVPNCQCAGDVVPRQRFCKQGGKDSGNCAINGQSAYSAAERFICQAPTCNQGKPIVWSEWSSCNCTKGNTQHRTCLSNCRPVDTVDNRTCSCPTAIPTIITTIPTIITTIPTIITTSTASQAAAENVTMTTSLVNLRKPKIAGEVGTASSSNSTEAVTEPFKQANAADGSWSDKVVIIVTAAVVVAVLVVVILLLLVRMRRTDKIKTQAFPIHVQAQPALEQSNDSWQPEVAVYNETTSRPPSRSLSNINRLLPNTPSQRHPPKPPRRNRPSDHELKHAYSLDNLIEDPYHVPEPPLDDSLLRTHNNTISHSAQYLQPLN